MGPLHYTVQGKWSSSVGLSTFNSSLHTELVSHLSAAWTENLNTSPNRSFKHPEELLTTEVLDDSLTWGLMQTSRTRLSLDHRIVWVGRDTSRSSPLQWTETSTGDIRLLRAPSNVSRDGASTASLGNMFQCFTTLIVKNDVHESQKTTPEKHESAMLTVLDILGKSSWFPTEALTLRVVTAMGCGSGSCNYVLTVVVGRWRHSPLQPGQR